MSLNFVSDKNLTLINSLNAKYQGTLISDGSLSLKRNKQIDIEGKFNSKFKLKDDGVKKLFNNKTISDVDNVEEIIEGDIFQNFLKLLKNRHKNIPKHCYTKCSNDVNESVSRKRTILK